MITVTIKRNANGHIWAFAARNHGGSAVCAAVSLMILNTVNSIEAFTDTPFTCDYKENGGYLQFSLADPAAGGQYPQADLLLNTMFLGLQSVKERYGSEITLSERK